MGAVDATFVLGMVRLSWSLARMNCRVRLSALTPWTSAASGPPPEAFRWSYWKFLSTGPFRQCFN